MADFCKACSEELFGEDFGDLRGLTDPDSWKEGRAAVVLCEGCGPIQVDPEGRCASSDCLRRGHKGHGLPFINGKETEQRERDQGPGGEDGLG